MIEAFIGIGSNLGDRAAHIESAINLLKVSAGIKVDKISSIYETGPVGGPRQGKFLNGAIKIETDLFPRDLLNRLLEIENSIGRVRGVKNGPRTIDLDILTYGDQHIEEDGLTIPHPRMRERDFVMRPLNELGFYLLPQPSLQEGERSLS